MVEYFEYNEVSHGVKSLLVICEALYMMPCFG